MFSKILVANRAEIAVRIIRACRELGIRTAAVYSEADKNAMHVRLADEAISLDASASNESYLNIEKILAAAKQTRAEAIHPGYGFLSENAAFAEAVQSAGLTFIGPPASAIRLMGDKAESKLSMKKAGVPTIPGREGLETLGDFKKAAGEIGYPVLVKAAAGGGGKGMRVVNDEREMAESIEGAHREASNAFGDARLLIERYLPDAHHVEFQVLGDDRGNLIHLFERECSVQRRYQKIIEETPSLLLTSHLREEMGQAAVAAAKTVGYANAGTVEFIVDPDTMKFYFLEMNTRLQVEHPVTELVAGLDLVQWQIRIAAGEEFPFEQDEFVQRGHAIECRIYAEDPVHGFLPSTGRLLQVVEPRGPGVRVDSGYAAGDEVTRFYDPLLAKLIVYAQDRPAAIRRMRSVLRDYVVHGVATNIDFLQAVVAHPDFAKGDVTTRWVETKFKWLMPDEPSMESLIAASMKDVSIPVGKPDDSKPAVSAGVSNSDGSDPYSPWRIPNGFRSG